MSQFIKRNNRRRFILKDKDIRNIDVVLLLVMIGLSLFGILNIYLCTKGDVFSTPYIFVKRQIIWFFISMIVAYYLLCINYREIYDIAPIFYWITIGLLVAVWIPHIGIKVNGARGWINLRVMKLQPAEFAKFSIMLMLGKLIEDMDGKINDLRNLTKIIMYAALPIVLILIEKDMGMTMVSFFIVLGIVFFCELDKRILRGGLIALFITIVIAWNLGVIQDYQKKRLTEFTSETIDVSGDGYQLYQGIIGVGAGGIFGTDVSLDPKVSPGYVGTHVPEVQTDFIFTAIAEQWGLLGAIFLLSLYGILITKMINIARTAKDILGSVVSIGMVSYLLFAIMQNIGMTIKLMPITGITLPLISYGGSSLLTTIAAITIVINIGMRREKINF